MVLLFVALTDECMLEVCQGTDQNICNLGEYMKLAFGSLWKEVLLEKQLREGEIDPGNPAVLVISLSAMRSLELLRYRPMKYLYVYIYIIHIFLYFMLPLLHLPSYVSTVCI